MRSPKAWAFGLLVQAISLLSVAHTVRTDRLKLAIPVEVRSRLMVPVAVAVTCQISSLPGVAEEHEALWVLGRPVVSPSRKCRGSWR